MRPVVSAAAEELYADLGTWAARDGEATGWALLLKCEALVGSLQLVYDLARDTDDGHPGWSGVLDIDRAPDFVLPWLAQFPGVVVPSDAPPATTRELIRTRPARARGRPATIIAAAQSTLLGSRRVHLLERDTSAYHFTVQTYEVQTPAPAATLAAIEAACPGGLQFTHEVLAGASYAEVDAATGPTYADREATFPTFADVEGYVP